MEFVKRLAYNFLRLKQLFNGHLIKQMGRILNEEVSVLFLWVDNLL